MSQELDLSSIRAVAADLDGVVWRDNTLLPGTPDFFNFLHDRNIPYLFMTNNSTRTVEEYITKIERTGITVGPKNIVTSAIVTTADVKRNYPPGTPIYVIGSESLISLLTADGNVIDPVNARVVIVGLDTQLSYQKLKMAGQRILAGAAFIGTNGDRTFPLADGIGPGCGTILAALQAMTGKAPHIMGKPEAAMFRLALERLGTPPDQTLMIGDRLDTDILGAQNVGMKTVLVQTGISRAEDIGVIVPDAVYESLSALQKAWK